MNKRVFNLQIVVDFIEPNLNYEVNIDKLMLLIRKNLFYPENITVDNKGNLIMFGFEMSEKNERTT